MSDKPEEKDETPETLPSADELMLHATRTKLDRAEKRVEYWRGVADGLVVAIAVVTFVAVFQRVT